MPSFAVFLSRLATACLACSWKRLSRFRSHQALSILTYEVKQPKDPIIPRLPMTGMLVGPSKSEKSTALVSMILEQYRDCFERVIIFSPSIKVDDSWRPVKRYIEEVMKVPTDREQVYFEDWDVRSAQDHQPAAQDHRELRNQLEKDSLLKKLTALLPPKRDLEATVCTFTC